MKLNFSKAPDFSSFFKRLFDPFRRVLDAWANSYKQARAPMKLLLIMVYAGSIAAVVYVPLFMLSSIYNNTVLGTILADIMDITDDGLISWWELIVVPVSTLWFILLSAMALLVFLLAKGKGFFVDVLRPSEAMEVIGDIPIVGSSVDGANKIRKVLADGLKAGFEAIIKVIPYRKKDGQVVVLKGASTDKILAFFRSILFFPMQVFSFFGGQMKNLNKAASKIYMSPDTGKITEIKK